MNKMTLITCLGWLLEAARQEGNHRRAARCRRAILALGGVA